MKKSTAFLTVLLAFTRTCKITNAHSSCGNDPAFRFNINNGETKKCEWLKTNARRDLYCTATGTSGSSVIRDTVKDMCPEACNNCPSPGTCVDSVGTVEVVLLGDLQSSSRYCSWFDDSTNKEYCENPKIKRSCPKACNACAKPLRSTECTLAVVAPLRFDYADEDEFECLLDPIDADGEEHVYVPIQITDEQKEILQTKYNNNEIISELSTLKFDNDIFINDDGILIPTSKEIFNIGTSTSNPSNLRRLAEVEGDKPTLVLKVTDSEGLKRHENAQTISDDIFGTFGDAVTLKSQMNGCSFGKVKVQAGLEDPHENAPGVLEVTIKESLRVTRRTTIWRSAVKEAEKILGHGLPGPYKHVMIVLEGCYVECGWAAYAYANGWLSVYQGNYYKYVGVQMHEIGHNLNLAHSGGLDGNTYSDHTGMMGNPLYSDDIGAMCYNAAKNWQLGWYESHTICIYPREQQSWYGTIVGIADYENNPENNPVIVKIETETKTDQFIAFNRATGVNRQNVEADDEVTIVEAGLNGDWYSQSFLLNTLKAGQEHAIPNWGDGKTLHIKVNFIDINPGDNKPGYAEISVCLGECIIPTEKPSRNPSKAPSDSPSTRPSLRPSATPSRNPSEEPSRDLASDTPSARPSDSPSTRPSLGSSATPSRNPSEEPSRDLESDFPSARSTVKPSLNPSSPPSTRPIESPSSRPTIPPTSSPSSPQPSPSPSHVASENPSHSSNRPSVNPSKNPTASPSLKPSEIIDREFSSVQLVEMGLDFDGTNTDDELGHAVSVSKNGLRVAIASPGDNGGKGIIRVYDWQMSGWVKVGPDITGGADIHYLGFSMDMNEDGSRIVVGGPETRLDDGIVQVYHYQQGLWYLLGNVITPSTGSKGHAGYSVTMNNEGNIIAYGAPRENGYRGSVRAFTLVGSTWQPLGQSLDASFYYTSAGGAVRMSADGYRLVIGSINGSGYRGSVDILDYDTQSSKWVSNGMLSGDGYYDSFGNDVAISEDGNRIIVGAKKCDGEGNQSKNTGESRVFQYDGFSWNQLGQTVVGTNDQEKLGESVAISGDGQCIAISSPKSDEDGVLNSGKVALYKYSETEEAWMPYGDGIVGEGQDSRLGEGNGSIALDRTGRHIVVGSVRGNYYAGKSRVFEAVPNQ